MTVKKILSLLFVAMFIACGGETYPPVENPLDAGRQFIDAIFKGNFKRADQLIVPESQNKSLLRTNFEDDYHSRNSSDRNNLGLSSININNVQNMGDSVTIIHFFNSYTHKPALLKVVKQNTTWLVDLTYTFQ